MLVGLFGTPAAFYRLPVEPLLVAAYAKLLLKPPFVAFGGSLACANSCFNYLFYSTYFSSSICSSRTWSSALFYFL